MVAIFDTPTFDLNADQGPLMIRVAVAMMALSFVATLMRFLARRMLNQRYLWDDWMIVVATAFAWISCIIEIIAVKKGEFGRHAEFATAQSTMNFFEALYVIQITYLIALACVKFSILLFYRRIFAIPQTKIPALVIAGCVMAWLISTALVGVFSCSPIDAFWIKTKPSKCISNIMYYLAVAIPNVVTDVALIIFPMPMVWKLKISRAQKIALSGMVGLGGFIIIVSCLRLVSLIQANNNTDFTWAILPLGIWTAIETNVGVVCACLPSMRPLFRFLARPITKSQLSKSTGDSQIPTNRKYFNSKTEPTLSENNAAFIWLPDTPPESRSGQGPRTTIHCPKMTGEMELQNLDGFQPKMGGIMVQKDITWS